jgi:hypothetical protein
LIVNSREIGSGSVGLLPLRSTGTPVPGREIRRLPVEERAALAAGRPEALEYRRGRRQDRD